MGKYLMNSLWYGEKPDLPISAIEDGISKATTETEVLYKLIDLFKAGNFVQKPLLVQLMNRTKDEVVLNLCVRVFFSIATHSDLRDSNTFRFLSDATEETINTFSSSATESLSLEVVPYLLALLEDWEEVSESSLIIKDSINFFVGFREQIGEDATLNEIGDFYIQHCKNKDMKKYYFEQEPVFPGNLTKELIERVMIAANNAELLKMEVIPSLLSIWSGEEAPGRYNTLIDKNNYKDFIAYVDKLSNMDWEKGQKYFYGHKLL